MFQVNKKVVKVNEFAAHQRRINCAMIGPKSGQYVATGGDDKVVNIWNLFNSSKGDGSVQRPLLQLVGHGSAVQCLSFDRTEEYIIAGSESGSLRLWDLGSQGMSENSNGLTCLRCFKPGHKAAVNCVDYHPYGSYFASGSADTNVKVWDVRAKNCLQTYKGHNSAITSLKFTPDGRMLVAGSANGSIKVWDLTSAREIPMVADPSLFHKKSVTNLQFHPVELLLATGSEDKTVKFWEFDDRSINFVASSELSSSSVKSLHFIGVDNNGDYIMPDDANSMHLLCGSNEGIRVYSDWDKRLEEMGSSKDLSALNTVNIRWSSLSDMYIAKGKDKLPNIFGVGISNQNNAGYLSVWVVVASRLSEKPPSSSHGISPVPPFPRSNSSELSNDSPDIFPVKSEGRKNRNILNESLTQDVLREVRNSSPPSRVSDERKNNNKNQPHQRTENINIPDHSQIPEPDKDGIIPKNRDERPIGLKVDDFLTHSDISEMSDSQIIANLMASHENMCSVMQARLTNMKLIERLWASNVRDVREAMKLVVNQFGKHRDHALAVDVLRIVIRPDYVKRYLNLDICVMLLPLVKDLCGTRFEEYITTALHTATVLYNCFHSVITANLTTNNNVVDLSAEDRRDKCETCQRAFLKIKQIAESKFTHRVDEIGTHARTYVKTMGSFGMQ